MPRRRGSGPDGSAAHGGHAGAIDPDFERSVRRWLRAYPRRWRVARGDEVFGTLADLADPGATRLDGRSALGLLVGGLRTRVRTGPPLHQRIGYLFGARTSSRYLGWVADDLAAPLSMAGVLSRSALYGLYGWPAWVRGDVASVLFVFGLGLWSGVGDGIGPGQRRRRGLRLLLPHSQLIGPRWVEGRLPRERAAARDVSAATTLCLAWVTGVGIVGWARANEAVAPWDGAQAGMIALLVGVGAAVLAGWRWRRWANRGPEQPDRVVLRWKARSAVGALGFGALALWSTTGASGYAAAVVSAALALGGLITLPAAAFAWRWSATTPGELAAVDLAWVAATGRPPKQDALVPAAVPAGTREARRGTSLIDLIRVDPDQPALG